MIQKAKRDSTLSYVKGKRYGEYKAWHDNGNISVSGSFFDDKKNKNGTGFQIIRHWILPKHLTWENWMVQLFFHLKMVIQKKELTTNRPELMV